MSEVKAYFEMWGINTLDERETLTTHIKALDTAYIEYSNEKIEQDRKQAGGR